MTCHLVALCVDANDPVVVARFWEGVLGWELTEDAEGGPALLPSDDTGFRIRFLRTEEPKTGPNQVHFDLTSASLDDQQQTVARALWLGGRHIDIGQRPEDGHVVLADLEGNEFCVIEPGNSFLADCGFIGALSSDGSPEVGYFWSEALGWPLVWDQDQETAIRSPRGGPKITWGGPPVRPKAGRNRIHFHLAPAVAGDQQEEVERLVGLGATRVEADDTVQGKDGRVAMIDPDGNEFCVVTTPQREDSIVALADRLQEAIVAGDLVAASGIYADDLVVWHNYDRVDCDRATSLAAIAAMATAYQRLTITDVRRDYLADGYVQRSVFHATNRDGTTHEVDAMMRVWVRDGQVTRIEEYTDTAATRPRVEVATGSPEGPGPQDRVD